MSTPSNPATSVLPSALPNHPSHAQPPTQPIAAIATAPGRGGVGIVRISGMGLSQFVRQLLGRELVARHATYMPFADASGQPIDHGLALWFPAPHSYTGEDVLELHAHGGPVVLQLLLAHCLQCGATLHMRLARPGEFTERAYLNAKLDLAQAEAVADLIDASTEAAARSASRSLSGAFSQHVHALRDALLHLRMLVEATLDFPEEDIDFLQQADARGQLAAISTQLDSLRGQARQGALLREGLHVVIAGQPNAGKSSLLNALAGAELAIVTPIAGTTRDKVTQTIQIEGVPLHIIDTAGLRDHDNGASTSTNHATPIDAVEAIGIERAWSEITRADVVLFLHDLSRINQADYAAADAAIAQRLPVSTPVLHVGNKADLLAVEAADGAEQASSATDMLHISAQTGLGLDALRTRLLQLAGWQSVPDGLFMARERHLHALQQVHDHIALATEHLHHPAPALDILAEELRLAHQALGEITGQCSPDELLGHIFSQFCIGK